MWIKGHYSPQILTNPLPNMEQSLNQWLYNMGLILVVVLRSFSYGQEFDSCDWRIFILLIYLNSYNSLIFCKFNCPHLISFHSNDFRLNSSVQLKLNALDFILDSNKNFPNRLSGNGQCIVTKVTNKLCGLFIGYHILEDESDGTDNILIAIGDVKSDQFRISVDGVSILSPKGSKQFCPPHGYLVIGFCLKVAQEGALTDAEECQEEDGCVDDLHSILLYNAIINLLNKSVLPP